MTLLRLVTAERAGHHWTDCMEAVCFMRGLAPGLFSSLIFDGGLGIPAGRDV